MSGFLGVLDAPVLRTHFENVDGEVGTHSTKPRGDSVHPKVDGNKVGWNAQASEMSAKVASVVLKVDALAELLEATTKNRYGEAKMDDGSEKTR